MPLSRASVLQKLIVAFAVIAVNFIGGAGLAILVDERLLVLALVAIIGAMIYITMMRCPRCRHFGFKHEATLGGLCWTYWGGNPFPPTCSVCNWDFRKEFARQLE
jgi:hypothetical protein